MHVFSADGPWATGRGLLRADFCRPALFFCVEGVQGCHCFSWELSLACRAPGTRAKCMHSKVLKICTNVVLVLVRGSTRTLTSLEYFVVFANLTDDEATVQRKRRLLVRREVTDEISALYRENLSMYRDIPTNHDYYPGDSSERLLEENSHDDGQDSTIITDVLESSDRVGAVQHFSDVEVVSATGFLRASQGGEGNPTVQVTRSNEIVDHRQKSYEIAGFPDLHSNGLGTVYDDSREIHVSPPEARRHIKSK